MQAVDQLNRTLEFDFPPQRIVSLVPSQSELLWHLGLQKQLAGITKFCIHPKEMFSQLPRVGGTKELKFDVIEKLQPDLIIANKEENEQDQIEELCRRYPVWISDIHNLDDALQMILGIGEITNRKESALKLTGLIKEKYALFKSHNPKSAKHKYSTVAYLIWKNPYMAAGHNTFIDHMLQECGLKNIFSDEKSRYPEVTALTLAEKKPDLIFLSSEPYPFKEKHISELLALLPETKILLVDGEMFSWYGSRLQYTFDYLTQLLRQLEADHL